MIPRSILSNLSGLRLRERLLLLVRGVACWLAFVLVVLLASGFIDWFIDRDQDTPWLLREILYYFQIGLATITACYFILWPQIRKLGDDHLALYVEEKLPHLRHRLISAVQLNRPGADVQGMAPGLIALVTQQAETESHRHSFASLADHRRLLQAAQFLFPALLLIGLPFLLWPELSLALLQRQSLADIEIPRTVHLANVTKAVFPQGDKVHIRFEATGPGVSDNLYGFVTVTPDSQPSDRFELELIKPSDDGMIYGVEIPAGTRNLTFTARLGDGRTRSKSRVTLVPRPVITQHLAWVQLPASCGLRPDQGRYEIPQGRGDVVGIPGSRARVTVKIQKRIVDANLELWGPEKSNETKDDDAPLIEIYQKTLPMTLSEDGQSAETVIDLTRTTTAYRIKVTDEYGFENTPPPRRSLRVVDEEAPQVFLLKDTFGEGADSDLEGMPIILGGPVRIPYVAYGNYGLGQAQVLYRVVKKRESTGDEPEETPWVALPLPEVVPGPNVGPFDPQRGVFEKTPFNQAIPFHAVPSPDPARILPRMMAGGRVFLQTKGLNDAKGQLQKLSPGDQIEYCVEVYADKDSASDRPRARSETRVASIVTPDEFAAWNRALIDEENRLRQLNEQQKTIFGQRD